MYENLVQLVDKFCDACGARLLVLLELDERVDARYCRIASLRLASPLYVMHVFVFRLVQQ